MFELENSSADVQMIDFGRSGKVLFQLPVLGGKGVPLGVVTAFSLFWDKYQTGRSLTEQEVASAWNMLIQTLADTYPDATRQMARLDGDQLAGVIKHWVEKSSELGFDPDPKAA